MTLIASIGYCFECIYLFIRRFINKLLFKTPIPCTVFYWRQFFTIMTVKAKRKLKQMNHLKYLIQVSSKSMSQ